MCDSEFLQDLLKVYVQSLQCVCVFVCVHARMYVCKIFISKSCRSESKKNKYNMSAKL